MFKTLFSVRIRQRVYSGTALRMHSFCHIFHSMQDAGEITAFESLVYYLRSLIKISVVGL